MALALLVALLAPADPSLPDGNALVRELARKQRHWEDILDSYTYDMEVVREDLSKEEQVTRRRSRRLEVFYVKDGPSGAWWPRGGPAARRRSPGHGGPRGPGEGRRDQREPRGAGDAFHAAVGRPGALRLPRGRA
jgi:hypothetical protein